MLLTKMAVPAQTAAALGLMGLLLLRHQSVRNTDLAAARAQVRQTLLMADRRLREREQSFIPAVMAVVIVMVAGEAEARQGQTALVATEPILIKHPAAQAAKVIMAQVA